MVENVQFEEMKRKALISFIHEYEDNLVYLQKKGMDITHVPTPTEYLDDTYSVCRTERELLSPVHFVKRKVEKAIDNLIYDVTPVVITAGVTAATALMTNVIPK